MNVHDLNAALCNAFGLPTDRLTAADIRLRPGELPAIYCSLIAPNGAADEVKEITKQYTLTAKTTLEPDDSVGNNDPATLYD